MPLPPGSDDPREYGLTDAEADSIWDRYNLRPAEFRSQEEGLQARILVRIQYPDIAEARANYFSLAQLGDDGTIPDGAHSKAAAQLFEMRDQTEAARGLVGGLSAGPMALPAAPVIEEMVAGLAPDNTGWKSLGPGNIGGRIRSILIDPVDTQRIYIGSVGGGVWISTDGGQSWQPADDLMANLAVCSMAMDPTNNATLYAGTGEGYYNGDAIRGDGIFKSNGGWVWQPLAQTQNNADFRWVNALAVNSDGTLILAGTSTGIFSSADAGATWTKRFSGDIGSLRFNPADKTKAVAGLLWGGGLVYSTDGGLTWTAATLPAIAGTLGRIQICYAANDPNRVYASVQNDARSLIWASDDGGRTFGRKGNGTNYLGGQGWYANIIWAGDPTNKDFVIVGGLDLWRSTDGGATLTQISQWQSAPRSAHADHHMIIADPGYDGAANKIVYFGNDGGIYKATNASTVGGPPLTSGWTFLGSKLPITQFFSGAANAATMTVIGGAQDNGTLRYRPADGANAWSSVFGGDGGYVASDPVDSDNYYGEYVYLSIFRNTSGADNQTQYICGRIGNGWKPAPFTITDAQNSAALFIAPFLLDPNDHNRLLAGGASLWLSTDPLAPNPAAAGPSWTAIKQPAGNKISAVAVAHGNSDLALVGYDNSGRIDKSVNATAAAPAWTRIDTNGIVGNRMCTWLAIDGNDNNRYFATFGGFQANNVWTSADGGASWTSIAAGLPQAPVRCVTIHPQNSEWIYIGTEVGVFASEDRGQTWSPANAGATNCVIYQLFWLDNTLYCASHGRGMFSTDLTIHQQATLVVTAELTGTLTALNGQTGVQASIFATAPGEITTAPAMDGDSVYCGYAQPFSVKKFADASNLAAGPVWQSAVGGAVNATPALVKGTYTGDKDLLYVAAGDGKLSVLDAATGVAQWTLQVVPAAQVGAGVQAVSCAVMNQWIYVATDQGLYAVNGQTKAVAWSNPAVCVAPPLAAANTLYVPDQGGTLHALDPRTGTQKWTYASGAAIASTPVWVLGTVVFGDQMGNLAGLAYDTGAVQFSASFAGEQINAMVADGNEIYFAGNALSGHLYAYRLTVNGAARSIAQLWSAGLTLGATALPPVVGTTLYVTTSDRHVIAFDTETGAQTWTQRLPSIAAAAPALVYA